MSSDSIATTATEVARKAKTAVEETDRRARLVEAHARSENDREPGERAVYCSVNPTLGRRRAATGYGASAAELIPRDHRPAARHPPLLDESHPDRGRLHGRRVRLPAAGLHEAG